MFEADGIICWLGKHGKQKINRTQSDSAWSDCALAGRADRRSERGTKFICYLARRLCDTKEVRWKANGHYIECKGKLVIESLDATMVRRRDALDLGGIMLLFGNREGTARQFLHLQQGIAPRRANGFLWCRSSSGLSGWRQP